MSKLWYMRWYDSEVREWFKRREGQVRLTGSLTRQARPISRAELHAVVALSTGYGVPSAVFGSKVMDWVDDLAVGTDDEVVAAEFGEHEPVEALLKGHVHAL